MDANFYFRWHANDLAVKLESRSYRKDEKRAVYKDGTVARTVSKQMVFERYDISNGYCPIITHRPIAWRKAISEILWIYQDQSNDLTLLEEKHGIKWWRPWDIGDGTIGQRYGATVARYDLMNNLLNSIKSDPSSRRHVMNLYQYSDLEETPGLYPCAFETIWSVDDGVLNMTLIQRSSDFLVANSINKVQYVALQLMVAKHCGLKVGKFAHYVHDLHIYDRHEEALNAILEKLEGSVSSPKLILDTDKTNFFDFTVDDFKMLDYEPTEIHVKLELAE